MNIGVWLLAPALMAGCGPLCPDADATCLALTVEGEGVAATVEVALSYETSAAPGWVRLDGMAFDVATLPLQRRLPLPEQVTAGQVREVAVRQIDRNSGLQLAGSTRLSWAPDKSAAVTIPLAPWFQRVDIPSPNSAALHVHVSDVNGDKRLDIVTIHDHPYNRLDVFSANADGAFRLSNSYSVQPMPRWVTIGDLDKDGINDILVGSLWVDYKPDVMVPVETKQLLIVYGQTADKTTPLTQLLNVTPPFTAPRGWLQVGITDLDLDGQPDILATTLKVLGAGCPGAGPVQTNVIFAALTVVGRGMVAFKGMPQEVGLCEDNPTDLDIGNLDQDAHPEIVITHGNSLQSKINVLGFSNSVYGLLRSYPVGNEPYSVVRGNYTEDKSPDLAVVSRESSDLTLFKNQPGLMFVGQRQQRFGILQYGPQHAAGGDFDGDGLLDLVTADGAAPTVSLLRGHGDGTFEPPLVFAVGHRPIHLAAGDLDGDGRQDLVVVNAASPFITVLFNRTPRDGM